MMTLFAHFAFCYHIALDMPNRHPYELGGTAFSFSMVWAQAMPFVALLLYERMEDGGNEVFVAKSTISTFLISSFVLWLITNVAFFCTIDLSFLNTFFGTMTGQKYTCHLFSSGETDYLKFDAVFTNRLSYTKAIHGEVKMWVAENIDKWRENNEEWFQADKVPDEFLPARVQVAEGGASRRRSSGVSFKEVTELVAWEKLKREDD